MSPGTHADWVARHLGRSLAPIEQTAVEIVCGAMRLGPWNLRWTSLREHHVAYATISVPADRLSTFDVDALTRLVVIAHDRCCRIQIAPAGPRHIQIGVSPRSRDGDVSRRHPTIEQAIADVRGVQP